MTNEENNGQVISIWQVLNVNNRESQGRWNWSRNPPFALRTSDYKSIVFKNSHLTLKKKQTKRTK